MKELKKGDKVRVLVNRPNDASLRIGAIVKVVELMSDNAILVLDERACGWRLDTKCVEKVTNKRGRPKKKITEGELDILISEVMYENVSKKLYTVSTIMSDDLEYIKKRMLEWDKEGNLNENTKIMEVVKEIPWKKEIVTSE